MRTSMRQMILLVFLGVILTAQYTYGQADVDVGGFEEDGGYDQPGTVSGYPQRGYPNQQYPSPGQHPQQGYPAPSGTPQAGYPYPAQGQYPGNPGYPPQGQYPGNPGYPAQGQYPGNPGYPPQQQYPGNPGYPPPQQYPGNPGYPPPQQYPGNQGYPPQQQYPGGYGPDAGDGLPIVYAGEGMRISVDQIDPSGTLARGTMTLGNQAPMPIEFRMMETQNGIQHAGQVMSSTGPRPFRGWDESEDVTIAEYEGRRYRLIYQDVSTEPDSRSGYDRNPPTGYHPQPGQGDNAMGTQQQKAPAQTTIELEKHSLGGTHTLLAPKGWTVEGGVWQPPIEAYNWLPSRNIVVTAPDGTQIHFRRDFKAFDHRPAATAAPQPGSLNREQGVLHMPMPSSPEEWARWIEQDVLRASDLQPSNVRVVAAEQSEALTRQLRRLHAPMQQFLRSQSTNDAQMQSDQIALTVRSSFQARGQSWEQLDAFSNLYAAGQIATVFGRPEYINFWEIQNSVSMRAPAGQLNSQLPVILAVVNSLRMTPEWTRQLADLKVRLSGIRHEIAMQAIESYAQIAANTYKAGQEVNDIIMAGHASRNAAVDSGQRDFVNYIRDMQDYSDGANSVVTLPHGYDRVFSNGLGQYLLTNDASFEPDPDWAQIQARR